MKGLALILLLFTAALFGACQDDSIDYREKIIGKWELKNVGELQSHYRNQPYVLKNACLIFDDNGVLQTKLKSSTNTNTWITEQASWSMPKSGKVLTIKSETGPFNDGLEIFFTDERTFNITLNDLDYIFVKL
jgi:hypothetical protein